MAHDHKTLGSNPGDCIFWDNSLTAEYWTPTPKMSVQFRLIPYIICE